MRKTVLIFLTLVFAGSARSTAEQKIRAGHFSTVTHAPALIARGMNSFEKTFEGTAAVDWKIFNAGPSAIEALFTHHLDVLFVGPNPAVNGFLKSQGEALVVVAGVAGGGSALVVRADSNISKFEDIRGKKVASPQAGNTQDIALRYKMKQKGLKSKVSGGDVEIFNIGGGDQLIALAKGDVQAIWTVEPWVSRLVAEAGGKILFDEKELWPDGRYATAVLAVRKKFRDEHPDVVQKWVDTYLELLEWMRKKPEEAKRLFNEELKRETGKALPDAYLKQSFERIEFLSDPMESSLRENAKRAFEVGLLGKKGPDVTGLIDRTFLDHTNRKKNSE